jgi:hypothetical protein
MILCRARKSHRRSRWQDLGRRLDHATGNTRRRNGVRDGPKLYTRHFARLDESGTWPKTFSLLFLKFWGVFFLFFFFWICGWFNLLHQSTTIRVRVPQPKGGYLACMRMYRIGESPCNTAEPRKWPESVKLSTAADRDVFTDDPIAMSCELACRFANQPAPKHAILFIGQTCI